MTVIPRLALDFLANAAKRSLTLVQADDFNAALKCLSDIIAESEAARAAEKPADAQKV